MRDADVGFVLELKCARCLGSGYLYEADRTPVPSGVIKWYRRRRRRRDLAPELRALFQR
jgi:hypothetical protein